jgi:hypothetical protein
MMKINGVKRKSAKLKLSLVLTELIKIHEFTNSLQ